MTKKPENKMIDPFTVKVVDHLVIKDRDTGNIIVNKRDSQVSNLVPIQPDKLGPRLVGHVLIKDKDTQEVLVDTFNAINLENMSQALAYSLADRSQGHIQSMVFGNGGSLIGADGTFNYLPPNVTGIGATLYNQTYSQVVDDQSPLDTDPTENYLQVNHVLNTFYSDVQITCTLDYNEPAGQAAYDDSPVINGNSGGPNGTYIFDELGLMSFNAITNTGLLLTHVIFHPVQKALNRSIQIIYTVRIILS